MGSEDADSQDARGTGGLFHNIARSMGDCLRSLNSTGRLFPPENEAGTSGCNGTWDGVLCWPGIPANTSISLPCPPLKGLDPSKFVLKSCHAIGEWTGRLDDPDYPRPIKQSGWTDYSTCFSIRIEVLQALTRVCTSGGVWASTTTKHPNGWTNFTVCMDPRVVAMYSGISEENLKKAQEVARGTRKLEFVGLGLSFFSLILAVCIFTCFRRLWSFRNQVHLQLMIALLMVVSVRLILYVDLLATENLGSLRTSGAEFTINTKPILCEAFYFALEFFKTVAFAWMFIEGFYLHNTVVVRVFSSEPQLWRYLLAGWGIPLTHCSLWLLAVILLSGKVDRCLGSYYLNPEFWILDGFRLLQLLNTFFLLNIVRVLWLKVRMSHSSSEMEQLKKSVKAALMLVPLLGIPNIMQTIPFTPSNENITYFAVYTYIASILYMFQGFMISVIYCFTNREVIHVLKSTYQRYRLQHSSGDNLRRGSRAASVFYQKNGQMGRATPDDSGPKTVATPLLAAARAPAPPDVVLETAAATDDDLRNGQPPPDSNNGFRP